MTNSPYVKSYYLDEYEGLLASLKEDYDAKESSYNASPLPKETQHKIFDRIWVKYDENLNTANHAALNDEEIDKFFNLTGEILRYIDDDVIADRSVHDARGLRLIYRNLFMCLKYGGNKDELSRRFLIDEGTLYFEQRGIRYNLSNDQKVVLRAFNIRKDKLCIDLRFMTELLYEYKPNAIYAELDGKRYDVEHTEYYAQEKVFGRTIDRKYTFCVEFPMEEIMKDQSVDETEISFYIELDGIKSKLGIDFNLAASKIPNSHISKNAYWCLTDPTLPTSRIAVYENKSIVFRWIEKEALEKRENLYCQDAIRYIKALENHVSLRSLLKERNISKALKVKKNSKKEVSDIKAIRSAYFKSRNEGNIPRIWMYFDKLLKAGDNGEYAFRYAFHNDDSIECYYVINQDSPDYPRLKEEFGDHILTYGSHKAMLYALLAETVVATHPNIMSFFGYSGDMVAINKDLFNPYLVCIAHGVTIQKNADFQNRLEDNTMFYTTSSKYEVEHLLKPVYGYKPEEIALTGMARFDGLINDDKKQILIAPTWRRNVVGETERNQEREYNKTFRETNYYKIYNALINDSDLIDAAKKNGYSILYFVHPGMASQIGDYERNDYVKVVSANEELSYETVLRESSLLITDYSGIHYDFAYMRKPVIYYQPTEIPMRFEEGGMKFETMGFGPVVKDYEAVIKTICEYINNNCEMPEKYRLNADAFFAFSDHNNCERIHNAIKTWVETQSAQKDG